jgi:hypothetical protein
MKRLFFLISTLLLAGGAGAVGTAELVTDEAALEVLNKKCIRLGTSELLPIQFDTACAVLGRGDLIQAMQAEFAQSISKNGAVDFPIITDGPGKYHYINEKGKRTDITELYRKQTDDVSFDYIARASGKRFFGGFDVVVHLQVIDMKDAGVVYSVNTHAYPRNWLTRFSVREIGVTKEYFKKKMKLISWVAREIAIELCADEEFRQELFENEAETAPVVDEASSFVGEIQQPPDQ